MPDKRVEALNSINKNDYNSKYVTLSDNTIIGIDLIQDLKKYFLLEFKNKYRYNYRKWTRINGIQPREINNYTATPATTPVAINDAFSDPDATDNAVSAHVSAHVSADAPAVSAPVSAAVSATDTTVSAPAVSAPVADGADNKIYEIINEEGDDGIAIHNLIKYIGKIYNIKPEDKTDIEIPEKIFNSDIKLRKNYRDKSINGGYIPIIKIEISSKTVYYKPFLEYNYTNYDFQEKSQIYDDLNKLNSIFKKNNYKDLDDLVILDFYKDFTKKVEKLKDDIIRGDDDIKYDLIDNIYEKLAIIYEIKIGKNKKIIKKPIKEILEEAKAANAANAANAAKTPKDICDIQKENKAILFNEILCDINKRAQILNNLAKLKGGGKHKSSGGSGDNANPFDSSSRVTDSVTADTQLNATITKILSSITDDEKKRYQTYLEIDKNILEKIIDNNKFKQHLSYLESSKLFKKVAAALKKEPNKIIGDTEKSTVTFETFNDFIEKIKDRAIEDSNRYLAIIKSLNIIMKNALIESQPLTITPQNNVDKSEAEEEAEEEKGKEEGKATASVGGVGYQKEMPSNIRNQGNKKQAVEDKMPVNPGKEYLKNLTDIYINLAKEYGKFINDENEVKELIKSVIKSPSDNDNTAATSAAPSSAAAAPTTAAPTTAAPTVVSASAAPAAPTTAAPTDENDEKKKLEDLENQNKENEKKSKNLEERKKQLTASLKIIKEELKKLYKVCTDINLPYATEYNDFVKNIIKVGQLKYIIDDNPQINNNNEIIEAYNKELAKIDKDLGDIKIDIESNKKIIKDKKEVIVSQGRGQQRRPGGQGQSGGSGDEEKEKDRLKALLNGNLYELIKKYGTSNLFQFIEELKTVFDGDDDNDIGTNNASVKKYNENETLYEQIWNDYSEGVKSYYNNAKDKSALTYINEGEKLKNKVILYDLDPEIVLKITFQDKVVFLALMFAIRTFIMVLFEFLIDYNVVKSLRYAILIYAVIYLLILLLFTAFVNLDSYKLRIVFNYLNMHINTPGIILHVMLFIIFSLLVIIIIQTDNFINNLGDILDYTYIYNYIYTFNFDNILSGEFENNLTKDEKIKLQYRLDIISMLIFIFSGILILLM
jgi:hypothetical protein